MDIYIGADHRGFALKERVRDYLHSRGIAVHDTAKEFNQDDDYPEAAKRVTDKVLEHDGSRGILICGSGAGMVIAANRFNGIRATVGLHPAHVSAARHDDDINVLVIAADYVNDEQACHMSDMFVDGVYGNEERYARRIAQLDTLV